MNTTIIAVRHGETEWNIAGKQQGQLNSPLSKLGELQAHAIAEGLKPYQIDFFYSSDLGRAVQTATIISRVLNKPFLTDLLLRERNLGILQGMTKKEFKQRYPDEARNLNSNNPDYVIPEGESIRQRYERSITCVEGLAVKHRGKSILIVAHGGIIMSFIHRALDISLSQKRTFSLFNGSINVFSLSDRNEWQLDVWGDVNHMRTRGLDFSDDN